MPEVLPKPSEIPADAARGIAQQMAVWRHDAKHPEAANALGRFADPFPAWN